MPIVPDTKNWTWVIERPCAECGYDAGGYPDAAIAAAIRRNAGAWPAVLERPDARVRPDDATWSPLEYSAHVRDVLRIYRTRLALMVDTDDPLYPNWDQDATAVAERYNDQDPAVVAAELADAASAIADAFDDLDASDWQRVGRRSDGANFTVSSISKYLLHDLEHHRVDVDG
jgi:DinB superfamily